MDYWGGGENFNDVRTILEGTGTLARVTPDGMIKRGRVKLRLIHKLRQDEILHHEGRQPAYVKEVQS